MRFLFPIRALIGAFLLFPLYISATTIVPYNNLGEATANSESVVLARALGHEETAVGDIVFRDTRFEVLENVKGLQMPGQIFSLRAMSYSTGEFEVDIAGDFKATEGEEYLLFLRQKGEVWTPIMLSYYVFEQILIGDDEFLAPNGGYGIETIKAPGAAMFEPLAVYQADLLLQNLKQYSQAKNPHWDGSIGRTGLQASDIQALDRAIPAGCDFMLGNSTFLARWQNAAIPFYYDDTNVPAGWATYFSNILSDMNTNHTGIDPSDAGTVSYIPNCTGGAQGGNFIAFCDASLSGAQSALIIFDDPCNQMAPLVNCGGVLAFGGTYTSTGTHTYDGQTWRNSLYGYVVVNDGVPTCWPGADFEQMLVHEMTHVYRMDHLDAGLYPDQNMNPFCCNAINTKDIECMNYAYNINLPVELSFFEALLVDDKKTELKWITQTEKDNAYFTVQRSTDGVRFEKMAELPGKNTTTGATYEWTDEHPLPGINYYLLSQTDWDGTTVHLGIKSVNLKTANPVIHIMPNPVEGDMLRLRVELPSEFSGVMEVVDKDGRIVSSSSSSMEKGSNWIQKPLNGLSPGVYAIRLFDGRQQFSARFTKK